VRKSRVTGIARSFLIGLALTALLPGSPPQLTSFLAAPVEARGACSTSYYVNVRGKCVHRPVRSSSIPVGASARCRDGTYSFSQSRRGTCSWHGGVAAWL
jgi:hypothetical protein